MTTFTRIWLSPCLKSTENFTGPSWGGRFVGCSSTNLPLIVAGDMNTTQSTTTYAAFVPRYTDTWAQLHAGDNGFTCCEALPAITNYTPALFERVDLFLVGGGLTAQSIVRVGADASDRTPSGLWPSDHAGVVAQVTVEKD